MPNNAIVLLTAQSDSTVNGLWTVSLVREPGRARRLRRGLVHRARQRSHSCQHHRQRQQPSPYGLADDHQQRGDRHQRHQLDEDRLLRPAYVPAQGNGIAITGNTFAARWRPPRQNGILLASEGLCLDPTTSRPRSTPPTQHLHGAEHHHSLNNWFPHGVDLGHQ